MSAIEESIISAIAEMRKPFRVAEIQEFLPGTDLDTIRKVLRLLRKQRRIASLGIGRNRQWIKTSFWDEWDGQK